MHPRAGVGMRRALVALLTSALAPVVSCSGDDATAADDSTAGTGSSGSSIHDPGSSVGGSSSTTPGGSLGEGTFGEGSCVAEVYEAEALPADLYVMFDSSGSMDSPASGGTRLDAVRDALRDFVADDASAGLGIGLGVFGHLPLGYTSCDPGDYAEPIASLGLLPGYQTNMELALDVLRPIGETPTGAAIRGACDYLRTWKRDNSSHYTAVLLVTDGIPEASVTPGCSPTVADAVVAAGECADDRIPVYVIGVGTELDSLDQIAAAGDTDSAFLVESDDVTGEMLQALSTVRGGATLGCEYQIPASTTAGELDLNRVNVRYVDPDRQEHDIYFVPDQASCDPALGGWYYDDPEAPTRLLLCASTCDRVTAEVYGRLGVAYGCTTVQLPE